MIRDPGSHLTFTQHIQAVSRATGTVTGTAVDLSPSSTVSFVLNAGTTSATTALLTATPQWSADNSSWTAYTAANGNDGPESTTGAATMLQLDIANPLGRYNRLSVEVTAGTIVYGVDAVQTKQTQI